MISLFRTVLAAVQPGLLKRVAFVLDLGRSDPDIVPWTDLDGDLDHACHKSDTQHPLPVEIRIQRSPRRNKAAIGSRESESGRDGEIAVLLTYPSLCYLPSSLVCPPCFLAGPPGARVKIGLMDHG